MGNSVYLLSNVFSDRSSITFVILSSITSFAIGGRSLGRMIFWEVNDSFRHDVILTRRYTKSYNYWAIRCLRMTSERGARGVWKTIFSPKNVPTKIYM